MLKRRRINIAIGGGSCTGKTTLANYLSAVLKMKGHDYDLIHEERRLLRKEMGSCRSPFERLYLWRQQDRQELRSTARDGFVTDWPLFHFCTGAMLNVREPRDKMAVRELLRMWFEVEDRYQLVVMAADPDEIPYKKDAARKGEKQLSRQKHELAVSFARLFLPDKLLLVRGNPQARAKMVFKRLEEIRSSRT
jgi:hypothetical protein